MTQDFLVNQPQTGWIKVTEISRRKWGVDKGGVGEVKVLAEGRGNGARGVSEAAIYRS